MKGEISSSVLLCSFKVYLYQKGEKSSRDVITRQKATCSRRRGKGTTKQEARGKEQWGSTELSCNTGGVQTCSSGARHQEGQRHVTPLQKVLLGWVGAVRTSRRGSCAAGGWWERAGASEGQGVSGEGLGLWSRRLHGQSQEEHKLSCSY